MMEGSVHYTPLVGPMTGTKPKLVHFPPISSDDSEPPNPEIIVTAPRKYHRSFFEVFQFLKTKRHERSFLLQSDPGPPQKKGSLKPSIQRQTSAKMESTVEASPYNWPHDGSLNLKTTALVIIDMQKDFCSSEGYLQCQGYDISPVRAIIPRLQNLLTAFREKGFPIYHTREGHRPDLSTLSSRELTRSRNNPSGLGIGDKGPLGRLLVRGEAGHDIIPELYPLSNENVIDKPGRSAFQHTDFGLMLNIKGIKNLVLCGVTTDVCVTTTMRDANDNNFDCVLVEDATAASEEELHKAAVQMVKTEGGIFGAVTSTENILAALEGKKEVLNGHAKPSELVVASTETPVVFL